jgi:Glutaredoxin-like domain (DUF836)
VPDLTDVTDSVESVPARITLLSKPGCHLCGPAREVIERVAADLGVTWVELSILDDPELTAAYSEKIPVTLVDGAQHAVWRVSESRLRRALGDVDGSHASGA